MSRENYFCNVDAERLAAGYRQDAFAQRLPLGEERQEKKEREREFHQ